MRLVLFFACLLAFVSMPAAAILNVRIGNLYTDPQPPNPIRIFGQVVDLDPLTLRDGSGAAVIVGAQGIELGQFLYVTGNWDGEALTVTEKPRVMKRVYPKYLSLGDSITFSPYNASIGWYGNWGMKASAQEKDFVHLTIQQLQAANPANAVEHYSSYGAHQAGGKITDVLAKIDTFKGYRADLITLQIGENDGTLTVEEFRAKYAELLDLLLDNMPCPRIFCFGVWSSSSSYAPDTRQFQLEAVMKLECDARAIPFRSLKAVATNPLCHDPGGGPIDWHPNDAGMQGYADLFWDAMRAELSGG